MRKASGSLLAFVGLAVLMLASGCATVTQVATQIGEDSGALTPEQAGSIRRSASAVAKTFQDITPEQEYYIGRSVAATVLTTYAPNNDEVANHYLNVVGNILAGVSRKPETFGGYHFQILDSDEVNAFAAPGGLIMVSKGMLRCCKSEDALAAVLAHEIGHIQGSHGLRAIRKGRLTSALTILAAEGAKQFGSEDLAQLTEAFEGSVSDITSTLMNSGYARHLEKDADAAAVAILRGAGYDPRALADMLSEMKKHLKPGGADFAKTHPDPNVRIAEILAWVGTSPAQPSPPVRQQRFEQAIGKL